jgi:hypothetical protein
MEGNMPTDQEGAYWRTPHDAWVMPNDSGATWEDYETIRTIESSYCHITDRALNSGQTPDLSSIFHPEAIYRNSFQPGMEFVGHDAVTKWYHEYLGRRLGYYRWTRHKIFEPLILIDGDIATASVHFDADSVDRHNRIRVMSGIYDDLLLKHEGRWLIKERFQTIHYHHTLSEAHEFSGWSN